MSLKYLTDDTIRLVVEDPFSDRLERMVDKIDEIYDLLINSVFGITQTAKRISGAEAHVKFKSLVINFINDFPERSVESVINYSHIAFGVLYSKLINDDLEFALQEFQAHLDGFNIETRGILLLHSSGYRVIPPSPLDQSTGIDAYARNEVSGKLPVYFTSSKASPGMYDGVIGPLTYDSAINTFNSELTRWGGDTSSLSGAGSFILVRASRDKIEYNEFCPHID